MAVEGQDDVPRAQLGAGRAGGLDAAHKDALLPRLHAHRISELRILQLLPLYPKGGKPLVAAVLAVVLEKVLDDCGWNDVANALRVVVPALQGLESDADARAVRVKNRTATVAAVDGGVDLDAQELRAAVRVAGDLDS